MLMKEPSKRSPECTLSPAHSGANAVFACRIRGEIMATADFLQIFSWNLNRFLDYRASVEMAGVSNRILMHTQRGTFRDVAEAQSF